LAIGAFTRRKEIPKVPWRRFYCRVDLIKHQVHDAGMDSLAALADPTRRRIVETLAEGALSSGEIAKRFSISAPAISQHLKTLRMAKLVRVRAQAQRRIYELDVGGIDEMSDWIVRIRRFWSKRLDALQAQLETETRA
jgi:DNA-binding transcriptional ArsR family regulator